MDELTDDQRRVLWEETIARDLKEAMRDVVYREGFDGRALQDATTAAVEVLKGRRPSQ